jgi:hypothetical protein
MSRLDNKPQIWTLAHDLGLKVTEKPVAAIVRFALDRVASIASKYGCKSLRELLDATACELGTVFKEVRSDHDPDCITEEYVTKGETIFANLHNELRDNDLAVTLKRRNAQKWEPPFVSVIDCRGEKVYRAHFSKWHELAHLLTLTPQMRLIFHRTHGAAVNDPEEPLMDLIAAGAAFSCDFIKVEDREISFESIARIRQEYCPEASYQASLIGIVKVLPQPCILLRAEPGMRRHEELKKLQLSFAQAKPPEPIAKLRAVNVTVNQAARDVGVQMHRNWRVPSKSVISHVFENGGYRQAQEDLDWWITSDGGQLPSFPVLVKAKSFGESVVALLIPQID